MIYDGLVELVNDVRIEDAQNALASVLNGDAMAEAIASGGTRTKYIEDIFRDQGIA